MSVEIENADAGNIVIKQEPEVLTYDASPVQTFNNIEVSAVQNKWIICSDSIYIADRTDDLPEWYIELIDGIINDHDISDTILSMQNNIDNLEEGYTFEVLARQNGDEYLNGKIEILKTSNDANGALIAEINTAYVDSDSSAAIASTTIGAWSTDPLGGGAWFNTSVLATQNLATAAVQSVTVLEATFNTVNAQYEQALVDFRTLEDQIDGVVETLFYEETITNIGPNYQDGKLDPGSQPYALWKLVDDNAGDTLERNKHTGDTYSLYEILPDESKSIIATWKFALTEINEPYTDAEGYTWFTMTDSSVAEALQAAINAQATADGKIVTYYQDESPVDADSPIVDGSHIGIGLGDIWVDSNGNNKYHRFNGTSWISIQDVHLDARVVTAEQAIVGHSTAIDQINDTALPALQTDLDLFKTGVKEADSDFVWADASKTAIAEGFDEFGNPIEVVTGWEMISGIYDGQTMSIMGFQADEFYFHTANGYKTPFSIIDSNIYFDGKVEFGNIDGADDVVTTITIEDAIDQNVTEISGNKITTGSIDASNGRIVNLSANYIEAGVIYNSGGFAGVGNYTMKIDLDLGEIHIV